MLLSSSFTVFLETLYAGAGQGLLWALLAIGVFLTFRILDFADLSVEGTFVLGASVAAKLISSGCEPIVASLIAMVAGGAGGLITGMLHTKLKIPGILAGILTMTALYSINMVIMGSASLSMLGKSTVVTYLRFGDTLKRSSAVFILGTLAAGLSIGGVYAFLGTRLGVAIRATGGNEKMARAQGINTDNTKMLALVISNALVGLAGALVAQFQGSSYVTMGSGTIVIGLASVVIGEAFLGKKFPFWLRLIGVAIGSIIYRVIYTLVIYFDILSAEYIKLLTAVIVALVLSAPVIKKWIYQIPFIKKRRKAKAAAATKPETPENGGEGEDNA